METQATTAQKRFELENDIQEEKIYHYDEQAL
jgi:hypothetical protein